MMEEVNTPFYLIDEAVLFSNIESFRNALKAIWPNSIIAYSVKTNSLPWVLCWMKRHDVYAEVVSDEEFELAKLAGFETSSIVFNGPVKTNEYLSLAFAGGAIVNLDSENDIHYFLQNKPNTIENIGIRINVDPAIFEENDVGFVNDGFRFGFSDQNGELRRVIETIKGINGNIPFGMHMHVNSVTRSLNVYKALAGYCAEIIKKYHLKLSYIDIGGGFFGGVPGKPSPAEYIGIIKSELSRVVDPAQTKLIVEPGSAAIGSAVELHTSVIDVKDTGIARIVTTDGSRIYIDPLWKKTKYEYMTTARKAIISRQIICGYTCMDHDRIMTIENEPELSTGNRIVYKKVGNYTVTFAGPFIKPFPAVYVKEADSINLVRKHMTMQDYYRMESIDL